ncbi:hypothetical protein LZ30DRAFT_730485 [Colletotrichum cereale]|nr:hypothetical protein LZ30DRAFT_730485 [Colletotrichum cereale]
MWERVTHRKTRVFCNSHYSFFLSLLFTLFTIVHSFPKEDCLVTRTSGYHRSAEIDWHFDPTKTTISYGLPFPVVHGVC